MNFKRRFPSPSLTTGILASDLPVLLPLVSTKVNSPPRILDATALSARNRPSLEITFPLRISLFPLFVRVRIFINELRLLVTSLYKPSNSNSFVDLSAKANLIFSKIVLACSILILSSFDDKPSTFETASVNSVLKSCNLVIVVVLVLSFLDSVGRVSSFNFSFGCSNDVEVLSFSIEIDFKTSV